MTRAVGNSQVINASTSHPHATTTNRRSFSSIGLVRSQANLPLVGSEIRRASASNKLAPPRGLSDTAASFTTNEDGTITSSQNSSESATASPQEMTRRLCSIPVGSMAVSDFEAAMELIHLFLTTTTTNDDDDDENSVFSPEESVQYSFPLLERILQEIEATVLIHNPTKDQNNKTKAHTKNHLPNNNTSSSILNQISVSHKQHLKHSTKSLTKDVVLNWQRQWRRRELSRDTEFTPHHVWQVVENWRQCSRRLSMPPPGKQPPYTYSLLRKFHPLIQSYNAILEEISNTTTAMSTTHETNRRKTSTTTSNNHKQAADQIQAILDPLLQVQQEDMDILLAARVLRKGSDHHPTADPNPNHHHSMLCLAWPNTTTYEIVLSAWLDHGRLDKVLPILDGILQQQHFGAVPVPPESRLRFNSPIFEKALQTCVDHLHLSQQKQAGAWADKVMHRMETFYDRELLSQMPHVGHYTQVIQAWAKSGHPQATTRAMDILNMLIEKATRQKQKELAPDISTYHAVLHTMTRTGDNMPEAEAFLAMLCSKYTRGKSRVQPDAKAFGTVLDGWSRTTPLRPDAGEKCESLLRIMEDMYRQDPSALRRLRPDGVCYAATMHAYTASGNPSAPVECERLFQELLEKDIEPSTKLYGTLIDAWAKVGEVDRAASILGYMCQEYQKRIDGALDGNKDAAEPDVHCFNILLNAYAQSSDVIAGREASRLLQKMWELDDRQEFNNVRPNSISYSSVINAWAKSGHADAGEEAEALLDELHAKYDETGGDHGLKPSAIAYNSVINAWAKCGNYQRAKKVFSRMNYKGGNGSSHSSSVEASDHNKDAAYRNVRSYNSLLDALSRSDEPNKGEKADSCIFAMEVRNIKPDKTTYMLAHKCWHRNGVWNCDKTEFRLQILKEKIEQSEQQK